MEKSAQKITNNAQNITKKAGRGENLPAFLLCSLIYKLLSRKIQSNFHKKPRIHP